MYKAQIWKSSYSVYAYANCEGAIFKGGPRSQYKEREAQYTKGGSASCLDKWKHSEMYK